VNHLGAYTANPSLQHYGTLKQILRYLVGTKDLGITYNAQKNDETNTLFHGYADATYANNNDLKSTTGYVFLSSGGAITWKSKKHTVIALSMMESEYIALSEAVWLRNIDGELGFPQEAAVIIKGDNDGSVILTHNPQFHQWLKHIQIYHHWIWDLVQEKMLDINYCSDAEQMADVLTKPLLKPKHVKHTAEMGVNKFR
jgi:hypothetical protein